MALVEGFLHFDTLVLNLLLVHVVLKVVPLLIQLLLDHPHSILVLALKPISLSLILQHLIIALLVQAVLIRHVFGAQHIALNAQFQSFLRLAILHARLNLDQVLLDLGFLLAFAGLAHEHATRSFAAFSCLSSRLPAELVVIQVPIARTGLDCPVVRRAQSVHHLVVLSLVLKIGVHWQLLAEL